jgi:peptidoglycan/xylan/chitin deacetylase (PgdA/CDA1 family)
MPESSIPILMYHSVDRQFDPAYRRWVVSPDVFDAHMAVLAARGCETLTVSQLADLLRAGRAVPQNTVLITFDDGLSDFGEHAVPLLEARGFASTLYVTTGYVGQTSRWLAELGEGGRSMLGWSDLAALHANKVELGAHTHSHPQLDMLSTSDARAEIETSKKLLEDKLGRAVTSFAYPHGYSTPAIRRLVSGAGFTSACRVAHGLSSSRETLLGLSRIIMTTEVSPSQLGRFLDGHDLPVARPQLTPQMLAWRAYRHMRHRLRRRALSLHSERAVG